MTGGSIIIFDDAAPHMKAEWDALAAAHGMRVVHCHPKSHAELVEIARENETKVIVHGFFVAADMGPYKPDVVRGLANAGVGALCHQAAGYDILGDMKEWKSQGIQVANCPNSVAPDTANTGLFLTLSAMRHFYPLQTSLRAGNWKRNAPLGVSPYGRTLGILGMGNIGRMYRDRVRPLGFKSIQYHGRSKLAPELEQDTKYVRDLDDFLATSDVLVIVVPLNSHTYHLLNKERLAKCKDGVVIVNIGRGAVVDEVALTEALDSGKVGSVGLDVYEHEPEIHPALVANPKITLLPHVGPLTDSMKATLEQELFDNVKSFLETGALISLVPELRA